MISHYIDSVVLYAESGSVFMSQYIYGIAFVVALCEGVPVIGTILPGTLLLLFLGYVVSLQYTNLGWVIVFATVGSILGELIGYVVGRYAGSWMVEHKKILRASHIEQGRGFFSRHGGKSILIGRFVGLVRPIVPLIAGSIGMRVQTFIFWNILGAFLWSALYIGLGFFFGAYAREIQRVVSHAGLAVVGVLVFSAVLYYTYIHTEQGEHHK